MFPLQLTIPDGPALLVTLLLFLLVYVAPVVIAYRLLKGSGARTRNERIDELERRLGRLDRRVEELEDRVDQEQ